jgi:hypothetical protein
LHAKESKNALAFASLGQSVRGGTKIDKLVSPPQNPAALDKDLDYTAWRGVDHRNRVFVQRALSQIVLEPGE